LGFSVTPGTAEAQVRWDG